MKVVKCDKNHYYDADKYETCPHCKNGLKKYKKEEFDDFDYGIRKTMVENVEPTTVDENSDDLKTSLLEDEQATVLLEEDPDKTVLLDN